ncbi:hypothetical protein ACJJTC_011916 [Scirpophaga incertulas]
MSESKDVKKKLSGSQNRKRKLEKAEKIKLTSPIDVFFRAGTSSSTPDETSKQKPTVQEVISIQEVTNQASTSSFTPSELNEKFEVSSNVPFSEKIANDPALWPQVIPDNLRSFLIETGPLQIQKSTYSLDDNNRSFTEKYYTKK